MTRRARKSTAAGGTSQPDGATDPVLADLAQVAAEYEAQRTTWAQTRDELAEARQALGALRAEHRELERRFATTTRQLEQAQKQAEQQKARAGLLVDHLKAIHRALFSGNIYELILKACLALSGATRGMYLTALGPDDLLRVRATVDLPEHGARISPFIEALCRRALTEHKSVVSNHEGDVADVPAPRFDREHFRNYLVAPVMLLHDIDGIVIVADKLHGEFEEEDMSALLSVGDQAAVAIENEHLQRDLQQAYLAMITVLADTMEAKDPYTQGHCEHVSRLSRLTARRLGLKDHEQRIVCYTALLHDIGKIGVSDGILNKPGPLLPEERELMRAHVHIGHDLVCRLPALHTVGQSVLYHHEWFDGTGYPDGLRGEDIPMAARIVSVVDAYCAMITQRPYKEAFSEDYARQELVRCAGTQFDPAVVEAFLAMRDSPEARAAGDEDPDCGMLPDVVERTRAAWAEVAARIK